MIVEEIPCVCNRDVISFLRLLSPVIDGHCCCRYFIIVFVKYVSVESFVAEVGVLIHPTEFSVCVEYLIVEPSRDWEQLLKGPYTLSYC